LHDLLPFCTEKQAAAVLALIEPEGNATRAAVSLGVTRNTIRTAIQQARKKADAGTLRPLPAMYPEDHELKGVSVKRDGNGKIASQWDKSGKAPDVPAAFEPVPPGHHVSKVSTFVVNGKPVAQWIQAPQDKIEQEAALHVALRASIASYVVPVEPVAPPGYVDEDTHAVIPVGDSHIGMLASKDETGANSDLKIQEKDLLAAVDHLVAGMPPSATCTIIPLGDNIHADDDQQVTPAHKHKLDVDGRAPKVARTAINIYRRMIDRALQRFAVVNVEVVGGNHDVVTSTWLRIALELIYENEPRVWVNPSPAALRVWSFGVCMFGTCHGDGIKPERMLGVMSARYREIWGRCKFVYGFQGHRHRKLVLEQDGGVVEIFRTLTGKDAFAAKNGYESGEDLVGITYHKDYGEIERKTVGKLLARSGRAVAA
jgi:hypothetical protein